MALARRAGQKASRGHVPERTCILCGTKAAKRDLVRIVAMPDGAIRLDHEGKAPGRGAYVCRRPECKRDNLKMQRLSHVLRAKVPESDWAALVGSLEADKASG
ncbi:MAG: YlxR family protein [SAR202 cluster bacterium]|nr:YlxR family protein [SAR202 cluster bacterium]